MKVTLRILLLYESVFVHKVLLIKVVTFFCFMIKFKKCKEIREVFGVQRNLFLASNNEGGIELLILERDHMSR